MDVIPAAILIRVSSDRQHEDNQVPDLQRFCAHHGLEVTRTYTLHDVSAYKGEEAATIELMKADAYRGEFRVVVVWALDRICRTGIEAMLRLVRELRERHCSLMSVQEQWMNGSDATTELLISIAAWMAQQESVRKSERTKIGQARARAEGKVIGGRKKGSRDRKPRDPEPYRRAYLARQERLRLEAMA